MVDDINALVDSLTLDEQVSLLAGADVWHTVPIERVGIPSMRVSDGPVGARGTRFGGGPPSIAVPCSTLLAATWDPALVRQVGELLGREARAKGARVLLAPTVNLHRTPIGGRNFECMSEDPYLTARTAVAYVQGLQSEGVASCIKHFVGNDTEFERMSIDARIDERTLRELYLVPFEAAVKEAGVMSVMTSYNRINGPWAADAVELIDGVLRGEWGFEGVVVSDWFGLHSTVEALVAGVDLEMPGPTRHRGPQLVAAVRDGSAEAVDVRRAAINVVRLLDSVGAFDDGAPGPETARDAPDDVRLARRAAAEGMVLLRNEAVAGRRALPLDTGALQRVAVIGPNAAVGQALGGGSAHVTPTFVAHPLDSLRARLGAAGIEVVHGAGCNINRRLPEIEARLHGPMTVDYFYDPDALDDPGAAAMRSGAGTMQMMWVTDPVGRADSNPKFGARLSTTFTPDTTGTWALGIESVGPTRLLIDRQVVVDNESLPTGGSFFGTGKAELRATVELEADHQYLLEVEVRHRPTGQGMSGVNIGAQPPISANLLGEAVDVAGTSDCSIVVVGTNDDWECEGWDRTTLDLPGDQNELISRVAAAGKRTVVVINAGSPVTMPWLDQVDAVVMAWFPGQQMGEAIADLLLGNTEPQGRLPVSFPARLEDTPAFEHYPGRNGVANYAEGRLVGYRWYETVGRRPLFPFGFGLGYAEVRITGARLADPAAVEVDLVNSSDRDGAQVVQIYAARTGPAERRGDEPAIQLVGFTKARLSAGDSATVTVSLDPRTMHTWSVADHAWVRVDGPFELWVGTSSSDIAVRISVDG
ncbi:MAG TPA: glycoside hydrolase family 3 C-terminal domain-containing protein [Ilumatobacteraceae bacterium]|nr:glycoside hydrolase family 3 C-terminal domain-containing protein [Ilumatobacteraceae bacterium]